MQETKHKKENKAEPLTGVWRQWRVTWLIEHYTSHQLLWWVDNFVLRNPPLRQAPKRYAAYLENKHDDNKF